MIEERLENVLQSKLNQSRVHRRAGNLPEGCLGDVNARWIVELRMVEHVKELGAKHQIRILVNHEKPTR
jgi:hypothetical protein